MEDFIDFKPAFGSSNQAPPYARVFLIFYDLIF